jgi:hypothetical protein
VTGFYLTHYKGLRECEIELTAGFDGHEKKRRERKQKHIRKVVTIGKESSFRLTL